jgi:hypothetical protein
MNCGPPQWSYYRTQASACTGIRTGVYVVHWVKPNWPDGQLGDRFPTWPLALFLGFPHSVPPFNNRRILMHPLAQRIRSRLVLWGPFGACGTTACDPAQPCELGLADAIACAVPPWM